MDVIPGVVDGVETSAAQFRAMTRAVIGVPVAAFAGGVGAIGPGHGVCNPTAFAVAPATPNAMKVKVYPGSALITGTQAIAQGAYSVYNESPVELTIAAAHASLVRRDLIIVQVRDVNYAGSGPTDARLTVVQGTDGVDADPSLAAYPNALVLSRVRVTAGLTAVTIGQLTDLRTRAGAWWHPRGKLAGSTSLSGMTGIGTTATSHASAPGNSAYTATPEQGRTLRTTAVFTVRKQGSAGEVLFDVGPTTGVTLGDNRVSLAAGETATVTVVKEQSTSSPLSMTLWLSATAGTVDLVNDGSLLIDDVGASLVPMVS